MYPTVERQSQESPDRGEDQQGHRRRARDGHPRVYGERGATSFRLVSKMLFDDPDEMPGIVGDECFKIQLTKAKSKKRGG